MSIKSSYPSCLRSLLVPLLHMLLAAGLLAAMVSGFHADFDTLIRLADERYGQSGRQALQGWHELLEQLANASTQDKLVQVNQFVNQRISFTDDVNAWGEQDYWATPLESLGRGVGDCEDSVFAKYVSLLELGIPNEQMRLTYVRARYQGQLRAHMILSYYPAPNQQPLILDNLREAILPASSRGDLYPIFSFNSAALWVSGKSAPSTTSPSANLSNWRAVLARMRTEGWR